jgi:hypothetical protein
VASCTFADLEAGGAGLFTQEITIHHNGMERVA